MVPGLASPDVRDASSFFAAESVTKCHCRATHTMHIDRSPAFFLFFLCFFSFHFFFVATRFSLTAIRCEPEWQSGREKDNFKLMLSKPRLPKLTELPYCSKMILL